MFFSVGARQLHECTVLEEVDCLSDSCRWCVEDSYASGLEGSERLGADVPDNRGLDPQADQRTGGLSACQVRRLPETDVAADRDGVVVDIDHEEVACACEIGINF